MNSDNQHIPSLFDRLNQAPQVLTPRQSRLISFLKNGGRHSALDISFTLHIGDARSEIRNLRKMGIVVSDMWVNAPSGSRYKLFWIENE